MDRKNGHEDMDRERLCSAASALFCLKVRMVGFPGSKHKSKLEALCRAQ